MSFSDLWSWKQLLWSHQAFREVVAKNYELKLRLIKISNYFKVPQTSVLKFSTTKNCKTNSRVNQVNTKTTEEVNQFQQLCEWFVTQNHKLWWCKVSDKPPVTICKSMISTNNSNSGTKIHIKEATRNNFPPDGTFMCKLQTSFVTKRTDYSKLKHYFCIMW